MTETMNSTNWVKSRIFSFSPFKRYRDYIMGHALYKNCIHKLSTSKKYNSAHLTHPKLLFDFCPTVHSCNIFMLYIYLITMF